MRKILFTLIVFTFVLAGCREVKELPQDGDKTASEYLLKAYKTDIKDVKVDFIDYEDFSKLKNQTNNFIVVASSLQCEFCEELIPNFYQMANEFGIKHTYFIKFNELDQNDKNKIAESFTEPILPTILFVKNANIDEYQGKFDIAELSQKFEDFIKE
ncbi:thioredoxin domain-containing protein [Helcococcus kunzii]|uniref:thioredoxin domain-containing protein n=1 Tax=Helcococcus kunzii TaxID=40091 RepID=UPI0024AC8E96|nr:thioredoxin domain-containing protein [Helcococcus kunzii]